MKNSNSYPRVLVCVTDQFSCERIIRQGKKIADELELPMQVMSVQRASDGLSVNGEALEFLYRKAKDCGAEMITYYNDDRVLLTAGHIRKFKAKHVVTGLPETVKHGFIQLLNSLVPDVPLTMVDHDGKLHTLAVAQKSLVGVGVCD